MTRTLRLALLAAIGLAATYGLALAILGRAAGTERYVVIDGDTLELIPAHCGFNALGLGCRAQSLRLYGVDAFESGQTCRDASDHPWPCGAVATERLKQLIAQSDFGCHVDPEFVDRHAHEFSICVAGDRDVGAVLVSEGLAFAYGRGAQYLPIEAKAKAEKRGAWAGRFVRPQYFRQGATD
ncbi:MAG TPA: thermonuclease family protein [Stellaceae bacterium]|nr:thermonuclease family protein [Stellaceae bacterium]